MQTEWNPVIRAVKERALSCYATLADEAPGVQSHLERVGLKAPQPYQQFFWSYCPEDALEMEKKIYAERFKEAVGHERIVTADGPMLVGYVSPLLETLRAQAASAGVPKEDWLAFASQRERAEASAIKADQKQALAARMAAVEAAQARRLAEAGTLIPALEFSDGSPTKAWIAAAVSRYFGEFGFEPVRELTMAGVVAHSRRSNGARLWIAVKETIGLVEGSFFGNYGLKLVIELESAQGPVLTKKPIFDLVDGFRVYTVCRTEQDVLLAWFAHAEVFRVLEPRIDACLANS
jgi:hypothetical protein